MPLRDMAATALAEHQTNGAVDHSGDDLPEELRSLVARKADKAAYSHLQVSAIRLALPFCLCLTHLGVQWCAALGTCRLLLRARGLAGHDFDARCASPDIHTLASTEIELGLGEWLPRRIKPVLLARALRPPTLLPAPRGHPFGARDMTRAYLHIFFDLD